MRNTMKTMTSAFFGAASILALASSANAAEMAFEHVMSIGTKGSELGQFGYVEDFAMAKDGQHIIVTDAAHGFVQVFDKTTGEFVSRFGGRGDEDDSLEKPEGISVAPDGRVFVADYATGDVKIYDESYAWIETFSEYGTEPGQNIKSEFTDIYEGLYYMPEAGNHRVSVWDLEGNFQFTFGELGTEPGQMNNPESAKFNSKGLMYVADLKNDRIQVFDAKGNRQFGWGETGSADGQMIAPAGIAIDRHDNVYVTEIGNDRVQVFDKDGTFITKFGRTGDGDGEFGNLHGMFCDKETGWLYIADTANNRVQVYKPAHHTAS